MGLIDIKRGIMQGTADSPRCNAGGGAGVKWMHVDELDAYHGRVAEGNGAPMKESEFLEAFASGIVILEGKTPEFFTGLVVGYKLNSISGSYNVQTHDSTYPMRFAAE